MSQSDWRQHLARNQYDLLPFLIGSIIGVVALTALRDFIRMPADLTTGWYAYFASALFIQFVALLFRSIGIIKPYYANTAAVICALPVLFYPVMEMLTGNMGGLLFLPIALLGVGLAVNSMAHLAAAHVIAMVGWSAVALSSTAEVNYLPNMVLNLLAIIFGALVLHRKIKSFRRVFELENRVTALESFLPICSGCKKTRDETGGWIEIESYLQQKEQGLQLTHGMCPDCRTEMFSK